jgi:CO/xanthine dehydrogenase Mo-binding subunit
MPGTGTRVRQAVATAESNAPPATRFVGRGIRRREDARLLRGAGCFLDDIHPANVLHAAIVRSPHAHARIRSVDLSPASANAGVAAASASASTS